MTKIAIVTGSTRPGRVNRKVADWVLEQAQARGDAEYELVDIADYNLPLLDEPYPAAYAKYTKEHTKAWSEKIAEFDGYVFVVAEYNHGVAPALLNAISYLNREWANKAAGMVGYGSVMGVRAVEQLRLTLAELQIATVQKQGLFSIFTDFENFSDFKPTERQAGSLAPMLDQLVPWTNALKTLR